MSLLIAFATLSVANGSFQPAQEKPKNIIIHITIKRMELGSIEAQVDITVKNLRQYEKPEYEKPESPLREEIAVCVEEKQFHYDPGKGWVPSHSYHWIFLNLDPVWRESLGGSLTTRFDPVGQEQLYPIDEYMLDITFKFSKDEVPRDFIYQSDIGLGIRCLIPGLSVVEEARDITENEQGTGLNVRFYLRRFFSSGLILMVLFISYALLGSLPLIKPDKLSERLSVCLSLFFFTVSFAFTQASTLQAGASLADELTAIVLVGVGLFSIISIIEKTLLEGKPKLEILQYPVEGAVLLFLSFIINVRSAFYANMANQYPWLEFPFSIIPIVTTLGILFGFVSKTIFFLIRKLRKAVS